MLSANERGKLEQTLGIDAVHNDQAVVTATTQAGDVFQRKLKAGQITKKDWQALAMARAGVDPATWVPTNGFIYPLDPQVAQKRVVQKVYDYYQSLYQRNPNLQWAGMARMAGRSVIHGLLEVTQAKLDLSIAAALFQQQHLLQGPVADWVAEGADTVKDVETTLLQMQKDIFLDLAWQHEAYLAGGIAEMAARLQAKEIDNDTYSAWKDIDDGIKQKQPDTDLERKYRAAQARAGNGADPRLRSLGCHSRRSEGHDQKRRERIRRRPVHRYGHYRLQPALGMDHGPDGAAVATIDPVTAHSAGRAEHPDARLQQLGTAMRRRVNRIVIACVALTAVGMLGYLFHLWSMRPRYVWDFTKGRTAASLGIPPRTSPIDQSYDVAHPGHILVRFTNQHVFDGMATKVTFVQHRAGTVSSIWIFLEPQTAEGAYLTAKRFADEWGVSMTPLDEWYLAFRHGDSRNDRTIRNDIIPACDIEVLHTYDRQKPFHVMLEISWLAEEWAKHPESAGTQATVPGGGKDGHSSN